MCAYSAGAISLCLFRAGNRQFDPSEGPGFAGAWLEAQKTGRDAGVIYQEMWDEHWKAKREKESMEWRRDFLNPPKTNTNIKVSSPIRAVKLK